MSLLRLNIKIGIVDTNRLNCDNMLKMLTVPLDNINVSYKSL